MKGVSRQIIGFVLGAVIFVIVLLVFAYLLSALSSSQIRFSNIQFTHWFVGGIAKAWQEGDWVDESKSYLKSDGDYNYMLAFVPNYTAKDINSSVCTQYKTSNCLKASSSFYQCIAPNTMCLCLFKLKDLGMSGLIENSYTWSSWGSDLYNDIKSTLNNGNGEIVDCENLLLQGINYEDSNGNIKYPYIKYNGDDSKRIFAIASDYGSGFEVHKDDKHNYLNLTER